jgi:hypothetical protein
MSEKENIEIRDIAHEFNVIVDSVKDGKSDFIHDRYFRLRMGVLRITPNIIVISVFHLRLNFLMSVMPLMTLN